MTNRIGLPEFIAELKPKIRQVLPKKITIPLRIYLDNQRHPFSNKYARGRYVTATLWIPDTPYSNISPKVCLTLSICGYSIRLIFNTTKDLLACLNAIKGHCRANYKVLEKTLKQAKKEQKKLQKFLVNHLNTVYTVTQGVIGTKKNEKRVLLPSQRLSGKARIRNVSQGLTTDDQPKSLSSLAGRKNPAKLDNFEKICYIKCNTTTKNKET